MTTPPIEMLYLTDRAQWRAWLAENHASKKEVWLIMYKKHTGQPCIQYNEAVEEALCFGWIDSLTRTLDSDRWAQKFGPRRPKSNWSDSNKKRVKDLIAAGRMTEAGMSTITFPLGEAESS